MVWTTPFGFAGGAGGVKNVERMLGVERFGRTNVGSFGHQLVPPVIATRRCMLIAVPVRL